MSTVPIISSSGVRFSVELSDPVIVAPPAGTVIWKDKMDTFPSGQLTEASAQSLFGNTFYRPPAEHMTRGSVVDNAPDGKVLRHNLPANTLGNFTVSPTFAPTDYASIEYSIRFDPNFHWSGGGKLGPGLVGVMPGRGIYEPTSGNLARQYGFSARYMWDGGDGVTGGVKLYLYATWPVEADKYQGYGWQPQLDVRLQRGVWHRVKTVVKMNTIGARNGLYESWFDGVQKFRKTDMEWRVDPGVHVQAVLWDIHRGGQLNPTWTSPRSCYVDIKDVTVRDLSK